jgi:hypothetical protein
MNLLRIISVNCSNTAAQDTIYETVKTFDLCQNRERTMVNEVLVTTGQGCGMSCLKMFEQYALLVISEEKLTTYFPYDTDSRTAIL